MSKEQQTKNYKDEVKDEREATRKPFNKKKPGTPKQDPFWYAKSDAEIKSMANFPFLEVVGSPYAKSASVPGIVTIHYNQTPGSEDPAYPNSDNYATKAASAYFQYISQGFTGSVNFEAADLLMTALAGNSVFAKLISIKRVFGMLNYYLQFNTYYAKHMVEALGFNFESFRGHAADIVSEYNIRVDQINKTIAVPKGFFIGDRWEFLESNLFTDTDSPEYSTAYAYVCDNYLTYDATLLNTGTSLRWFSSLSEPGELRTYEEAFADLDYMLEKLNDDDVRSMFGAIRRVYSDKQLKKASYLETNFTMPITKHDIVAMQLHNAVWDANHSVVGIAPWDLLTDQSGDSDATTVAMYQDQNGNVRSIIARESTGNNTFLTFDDHGMILDLYDHLVSPENVLDATANMEVPCVSKYKGKAGEYRVSIVRCEIINKIYVHAYNPTTDECLAYVIDKFVQDASGTAMLTRGYQLLTQLDSHPLIATRSTSQGDQSPSSYIGEINKYTLIDPKLISKLHKRTRYNLLCMPENSKSVTK